MGLVLSLLVVFGAIAGFHVWAYRRYRRVVRQGQNAIYAVGGIRVRRFNLTWPFASLIATHGYIEVLTLGAHTSFHRDRTRVSCHRHLISGGIRLDRVTTGKPRTVIFWSFRVNELVQELEGLGYEIESSTPAHAAEQGAATDERR